MSSDALSIMEMGHSQKPGPRFTYDDWLNLSDIGNGAINVPIKFSTAAMLNSAMPVIWAEAQIVIPLTITVQGTTIYGPSQLAAAFKGPGYSSLIDRVLVSLDGKSISDSNVHVSTLINLRQISGFSRAKVQQIGPTIGYEPDTATSGTAAGNGAVPNIISMANNRICENTFAPVLIATAGPVPAQAAVTVNGAGATGGVLADSTVIYRESTVNMGLLARAKMLAENLYNGRCLNFMPDPTNQSRRNISVQTEVAAGPNSTTYSVDAVILLRDVCDAFAQMTMPIANLNINLTLFLNRPGMANVGEFGAPPENGSINPFMITDVGYGEHVTPARLTGVRGVTMAYKANERPILQYRQVKLDLRSAQKVSFNQPITWLDHNFFSMTFASDSINWQVIENVPNLRRVTFIPIMAATSALNGISPMHSYKCCEPATASLGAILDPLTLIINGKSFHSNPIQSDREAFNQQQLPTYQGGLTENVLISGLVNRTQWGAAYRFYSFDVSRNPEINSSDIPVTVRLQCQSLAPYKIEMLCICEVEKQFVLNQSSAQCTVTIGQPPQLQM